MERYFLNIKDQGNNFDLTHSTLKRHVNYCFRGKGELGRGRKERVGKIGTSAIVSTIKINLIKHSFRKLRTDIFRKIKTNPRIIGGIK